MALDLAQFHDAFFDESFEALDSMEAALLKLNVGAPEPEIVNTIFRVAHSIKGGSATFGFAEVASFTHTCETLLDELRSNRMQVTRVLTDLLLKSVDVMREMLRAVQHKAPIDAQRMADVQFDLELAIVQKNASAPVAAAPVVATPVSTPARAASVHRWRIQFRPYPQLFAHGNDPLRMLRELADLGDLNVVVSAQNVPALSRARSRILLPVLGADSRHRRHARSHRPGVRLGGRRLRAAHPRRERARRVRSRRAKLAAVRRGTPKRRRTSPKQGLGDGSSIRVSTEKIDELMNTVGELVITQSMLTQLGDED